MKKAIISFAITILVAFATSCYQQPPHTVKTLRSGRTVRVAGVTRIFFRKGDQALMLKYYTDININNRSELQDEVEELWELFRVDVEKAGLKAAIISANEMPKGVISRTEGFNFVFTKEPDGKWVLTNDTKAPANTGLKATGEAAP
jgi:hypothetical protein